MDDSDDGFLRHRSGGRSPMAFGACTGRFVSLRHQTRFVCHRLRGLLAWGTRRTIAAAWADRVFGLAAEAAFWSALSFPPLLLTLVGLLGFMSPLIGGRTPSWIERNAVATAEQFLAPSAVDGLEPVLSQVLHQGHGGVATIGFAIALWAGSTAMSSYVNAITIAYGMRDVRSALRARLIGLALYLGGVVAGVVIAPLLVLGRRWVQAALPDTVDKLVDALMHYAYWPALFLFCTTVVTVLYHIAAPAPTRWSRDLPGAALAVTVWLTGSVLLRGGLEFSFAHNPIYAAVSAPIAGLLFLYLIALAVLVGAELNSTIDQLDPLPDTAAARQEATKIQMKRLAQ